MRRPNISSNFGKLKDDAFATAAGVIGNAMTGNSYFPTPLPDLGTLKAAINTFRDANTAAAETNSRKDVTARKIARPILEGLLHQLGDYVRNVGNGNETMLASSGFPLLVPKSFPTLTTPSAFKVLNGKNTGELKFSIQPQDGSNTTVFFYTEAPAIETSIWQQEVVTGTKCTVEGLKPGVIYACKSSAIASRNRKFNTGIINKMVI